MWNGVFALTIMLDDRAVLNGKTLCALHTVKDVTEQYSSVEDIPITPGLLRAHRNAYKAYKQSTEEAKKDQAKTEEKRKQSLDDAAAQLHAKKTSFRTETERCRKVNKRGHRPTVQVSCSW
jgi:hypothetical protein